MDFFNISELEAIQGVAREKYDTNSPSLMAYESVKQKLIHWGELVGKKVGTELVVVRAERFTRQGGRGKGPNFNDHVLIGFAPKAIQRDRSLFIKFEARSLQSTSPRFFIELDVEWASKKKKAPDAVRKYLRDLKHEGDGLPTFSLNAYQLINSPNNNWERLVEESSDLVRKLIKKYSQVESYWTSQEKEGNAYSIPEAGIAYEDNSQHSPQNLILYGPPGTGKTYLSRLWAVRLAQGKQPAEIHKELEAAPAKRSELNEEYNQLVKQGRIAFTTFHQSLSYEDFVEGIRPLPPGDNPYESGLQYEVSRGIFRRIADTARYNYHSSQTKDVGIANFKEALQHFLRPLVEEETPIKIKMKSGTHTFTIDEIDTRVLRFTKQSGGTAHTISLNTLEGMFNGSRTFEGHSLKPYYQPLLESLKDAANQIGTSTQKSDLQQYVLLIDEINRGNVASIFGELITLLEPDKRIGMPEAIEVMLPYSNEGELFGVPANLHIVGTMNTADRSVESLDAALRRRFSFIEMMPRTELFTDWGAKLLTGLFYKYRELRWEDAKWVAIEGRLKGVMKKPGAYEEHKRGWEEAIPDATSIPADLLEKPDILGFIDIGSLLTTLNRRIQKLAGRDYQIGHAYLFPVFESEDPLETLRSIFRDKILPLLQEYFFNDYGKIGLVLGPRFVTPTANEPDSKIFFASGFQYGDEHLVKELAERPMYRLGVPESDEEFRLALIEDLGA